MAQEVVQSTLRQLQSTDADAAVYEDAVRVTKIFSGIFFAGLAGWLSLANGTKLSFIQQAALEKRLTMCCFLGVYVGAFSAFFNFFQLTEVDDVLLDRDSSFTLDFSRPLEWIMTCPLMQLALVLMGGSRIPEYRRMVMPGLSVIVLCCGTASMLLTDIWVYVAYGVGVCFAAVMFWLNRQQIIEHSDGQECLLYGDSEFRKASILLIVTWVPFPTFYALSPEGFGVITDILFVQVGWAFLNIVSKFTFIFYIQRIKDNYCNRLKVKREFVGIQSGGKGNAVAVPIMNADGTVTPPMTGAEMAKTKQQEKQQGELGALVVETMSFLGMAQNSDRFLRLLSTCNIHNVSELEAVTQEKCLTMQLPWDLVAAVQKRLRVWRLEMQDEAELLLEKGELHYQLEERQSVLKNPALVDKLHAVAGDRGMAQPGQPAPNVSFSPQQFGVAVPGVVDGDRLQHLEETLQLLQQQNAAIQQQNDFFQGEILRRLPDPTTMQGMVHQDSPRESVLSAPGTLRNTIEATVQATLKNKDLDTFLEHRIEELVVSAQIRIEQAADKVGETLKAQARDLQATLETSRKMEIGFIEKIDERIKSSIEKTEERLQNQTERENERMQSMLQKLDEKQQASVEKMDEKLHTFMSRVAEKQENFVTRVDEKQQHFMGKTTEELNFAVEEVSRSTESNRKQVGEFMKEARQQNDPRKQEDLERSIARKLEDVISRILEKQDRMAEFLRGAIQNDMNTVMSRSDMVVDVVKENGMMVKDGLSDLKRININILDLANGTQEISQQGLHRGGELRSMIEGVSTQVAGMSSPRQAYEGGGRRDASEASLRDRPLSGGGGASRRYDRSMRP